MWNIEDKTHATHFCRYQGKTCPLVYLGCIFVSVKIIDAFLSA